ncbi:DUF6236 family protein, partial [Streptomyces virens]
LKRNSELEALRDAIETLYIDVINSKDVPLSKTKAVENIEAKVLDIHKVLNEKKIKRGLSSVRIFLNSMSTSEKISMVATGAAAISKIPLFDNSPLEALIDLTESFSGIISQKILTRPHFLPPELKDYAYLYYANKTFR